MAKAKGAEKTGGRKKGVPNKITADLKGMILSALDDVGGQKYLVEQAKENPTAFLTLVGKALPKEVHVDLTARIAAMSTEEKMTEALRMAQELGVKL